jgi:hypothetical protein
VEKQECIKRDIEAVREWFKDHVATMFPSGKILLWSKPGTGVYRVKYQVDERYLIITGDIGDAIFCWSQPVSFDFVAGCDLEYIKGKCVAKPTNIDHRSLDMWCEHELRACVEEQIRQFREDGEGSALATLADELEEGLDDYGHCKDEWQQFVSSCHWNRDIDAEIASSLFEAGFRTDIGFRGMIMGLRMALEQLKSKEVASEPTG